jgi:hypothetical protein
MPTAYQSSSGVPIRARTEGTAVKDEDAAGLRRLIPLLLELLTAVATGDKEPTEAAADYRHLHGEVRRILVSYGEECICPWPNVFGWAGTAAKDPDWQLNLVRRASKARILCGLDEPPPWTLVDFYRDGNPDDVPFWNEFAASLEPQKQAILDASLTRELAFRGMGVMDDRTKGHTMPCSDKPGARTNVFMFKIRQGSGAGEVLLRVFFITASGYRLVLLHGYDKGADTDDAREQREAAEACARREDVVKQRAAGTTGY